MTISITEWMYVPELGYDVPTYINLDYEPIKYTTKADAAKGLYRALCKLAKQMGQDPTCEVHIFSPAQSVERGFGDNWIVSWEAGPFEWACSTAISGPWGYCEPYYSFDLCFVD